MLGYIKAYLPELKVKDSEIYKSYYCGVCKSIGKHHSQIMRMTLSYDAAFLGILIDSLNTTGSIPQRQRCIANPFKKRFISYTSGIDISADLMLILAWYNLIDDINDDNSFKANLLKLLFSRKFKKLYKKYPTLCDTIDEHLQLLNRLERKRANNMDEVSDSFAKIMSNIFEVAITHSIENNYIELNLNNTSYDAFLDNLRSMGYHLGKWIYIIDAYDDIEDDITGNSFNPLVYRFEYDTQETCDKFKQRILQIVKHNLLIYLQITSEAMDKLPIVKYKDILENVIFVGCLKKMDEILGVVNIDTPAQN